MSNELREQLQSALGSAYTLQEELGGGGMSRVFLAHDPALDRLVVVKVLHPELAGGVSVERFKREILLAAQLQHPHIVPLLSTGEMGGLPYFTMPFVDGLSLRQRLGEEGPLPLDDALEILRDVARALAFAHGRGVIHRDIKPDNVLLAQGSATVTDFGVAKAVAAAMTATSTSTLTSVGTSIGTPAYMAPEQAAGDPDTDHRADIYAWGVMAFEMLAGRLPFTATAAHKLMAAHMSEVPALVSEYCPECPPALAGLIDQCLAKNPDRRPQSATELLRGISAVRPSTGGGQEAIPAVAVATRRTLSRALGIYAAAFIVAAALAQAAVVVVGLPPWVLPGTLVVMALGFPVVLLTAFVYHGNRVARTMAARTAGGSVNVAPTMTRLAVRASPHITWKRTAIGGASALGGFAAIVLAYMVMRALGIGEVGSLMGRGVFTANDRLLVTDFEAPANDSSLGTVVSEGVRTSLAQSANIGIVPTPQIVAALQRMQIPPGRRVDLALARQVAEREGIKAIVDGRVTPVAGSYIIMVQLYAPSDSSPLASYQESAKDATELIPAMDRAARRIREKVGDSFKSVRATPRLENVTTASLPALRKYTEGFRANAIAQNYPVAAAALEEAISIDSTFAMAMRLAALAYGNASLRPGRADSLRTQAFRHRARLSELERALVEAAYYDAPSQSNRPQVVAAFQRALAVDPRSLSALNNLALQYSSMRRYAAAESLFLRELELYPDIVAIYSNTVPVQVALGKYKEASATFGIARQKFPTNMQVLLVGNVIASHVPGPMSDSADTICRAVADGSSPQQRVNALHCLSDRAYMRGKLREGMALRTEAIVANIARGGTATGLSATLDSALIMAWFRERPADAALQIDRALAGINLRDIPALSRPYFPIAEGYAIAGRPEKARAMLAQYEADQKDTVRLRAQRHFRNLAEGTIAIAEQKYVDAIRLLQKADTMYDGGPTVCAICVLPRLAIAFDRAGQVEKAIETYEAYVGSRFPHRVREADWVHLALAYHRLGELYEARRDRAKAVESYEKFVELWKEADAELQPKVGEAKKRLERLRMVAPR